MLHVYKIVKVERGREETYISLSLAKRPAGLISFMAVSNCCCSAAYRRIMGRVKSNMIRRLSTNSLHRETLPTEKKTQNK